MTTSETVGVPVVSWWKGERGEWYVVTQTALFLLILFGPATASWLPEWPAGTSQVLSVLGVILLVGGIVWIVTGAVQLAFGRSLSALPSPTRTATLIDTGVFAHVRHPMYCGAIWAVVGCGFRTQGILMLAGVCRPADGPLRPQGFAGGTGARRHVPRVRGLQAASAEAGPIPLLSASVGPPIKLGPVVKTVAPS